MRVCKQASNTIRHAIHWAADTKRLNRSFRHAEQTGNKSNLLIRFSVVHGPEDWSRC
jgi:hypothetical protein